MLDSLKSSFAIPDQLTFEIGNGGLIKAVIATALCTGEVYLHGAHVTHFQPQGQSQVMFVSKESRFADGKPIRGGVPICFPWFGSLEGRDTAPAHGFARTSDWTVQATGAEPDGSVTITLELQRGEERADFWPHAFRATMRVSFGASLKMELTIHHLRGEAFMFEEALHSYFVVGDVREVRVTGLAGTPYLDKVQAGKEVLEGTAPVAIAAETDRVYLDTTAQCVIDDPKLGRKIVIHKTGSNSTVLWNPWVDKARSMSDFGDDEWPDMLCIETCNVGQSAVRIGPGQSHSMGAQISVLPRD